MVRTLIVLMCWWLVSVAPAAAQSNATDAALDGFVKDPSGALVPAAKIIALNTGTNQVHETDTDREGYFRFPLLQVGDYHLIVSAPGSSEFQQTGIRLSVGRQARVEVQLAVGAATETVTVTGDASMVMAGQGGSGEVLDEEAVRTLPITSRNVYNFHLVSLGVKGLPRHTTTNLRNAARLAFRYGLPATTPMLISSGPAGSAYIESRTFADRCKEELGYQPGVLGRRLSRFDQEFVPSIDSLHIDACDPLDP